MKKEFHELQWFEQMKLDVVEEASSKKYIISGPFTRCNYPNGNNRIYPTEVMQKSIEALRPKVAAGRVRMMVDHPMWDASMRSVGAIVLEVSDVGPDGYAYYKAQIVDTAAGKDLKAIIDAGGKVGVSTRGYGIAAYDQEYPPFPGKFDVIQAGFDLRTFDFVDDPSVSDTEAYCQIESNKKRSIPMKTIDELKSAHPELMESYKATIAEELKRAFDESMGKVAKENADLLTGNASLTESNKKLSETVKALSEGIKAVCPDLFVVVEESKLVEEAKAETVNSNKALAEAQAENKLLKDEVQAIKDQATKEAKVAMIAQLETANPAFFKMKSFESATLFANCLNAEEVKQTFERNFEIYKQIKAESTEPAPAKSVVEGAQAPKQSVNLTEAQTADFEARNKQRRQNGMESMSVEDYKRLFVKN